MKRREFLVGLGSACAMALSIGISGCTGTGDNQGVTATPNTSGTTGPTVTPTSTPTATATDASTLARTCPRGKSCQSPQCQLWSDLNSNGRCDRGYQDS
jgi:hypothetical protein